MRRGKRCTRHRALGSADACAESECAVTAAESDEEMHYFEITHYSNATHQRQ